MQQNGFKKKMIVWMITIIIAFPVLGLLVASVITYTMPKIYMSSAKVELVPSGPEIEKWGVNQYVATEMEVMRSDENLRLASQTIQLDVRWGMHEGDVARQLSRLVEVNRVGDGRMIKLICHHRKKEEAQIICKAVYEAYRHRKADLYLSGAKGDFLAIKSENHVLGNKLDELTLELAHATGTYEGEGRWIGKKREAVVVKREHQDVLKKKKQLEAKLGEIEKKVMKAGQSMIVHEIPEIPDFPVSPNIPLNQSMGLLVGFAAGCVVDVALLAILLSRNNKTV